MSLLGLDGKPLDIPQVVPQGVSFSSQTGFAALGALNEQTNDVWAQHKAEVERKLIEKQKAKERQEQIKAMAIPQEQITNPFLAPSLFNNSASSPSAASSSATTTDQPLFQGLTLPTHFTSPFAAQNDSSSSSSAPAQSVQLDFSEIDDVIHDMEEKKRQEIQAEIQRNLQKIANPDSAFMSLPASSDAAKAFHDIIVKKYDKAHNVGLTPKQQFQKKKQNRRDARRAKKAEDTKDKFEAKAGSAIKKQRTKHRNQVY